MELGWILSDDRIAAEVGVHAGLVVDGRFNVQPSMEDARIAGKRSYWESNGQVSRRVRLA